MNRVFKFLLIIQIALLIVWYVWKSNGKSNYQLVKVRMDILENSINFQGADGKSRRIVRLTVGKIQGIFSFFVYKPINTLNKATLLFDGCTGEVRNSENEIELITSFIDYIGNKKYTENIAHLSRKDNSSKDIFEARQMEVIGVLQDNLLHSSIGRVHVLVWSNDTAEYIKSLPLRNSEKLVLRVIGKDISVKDGLLYASECLSGKIVAIAHQDNQFGKGWNNVEYHDVLRKNDIMYALTRHSITESNCTWVKDITVCDDGVKYIGSHDVFVFQAKRWNAAEFSEIASVTPERQGMENLLLWLFSYKLKYKIINPCKRLFVHHHHCVAIRRWREPRVDTGSKSLCAKFTERFI